jgi:SAM-dependent methyltransferase
MTMGREGIAKYYDARADEYEAVYERPERQSDLLHLEAFLSEAFVDQDVLEVACGTGYWTQFVARSARSIVATDASAKALNIARKKQYGNCRMTFLQSDAFFLPEIPAFLSAGFHAFWWSHIPVQEIQRFLQSFHGRLQDHARVIMIDNKYVEGNSTPICRTDEYGNTYQVRKLRDGSKHEVLKNFPSAEDIHAQVQNASSLQVRDLQYYWIAEYITTRLPNEALHPIAQTARSG